METLITITVLILPFVFVIVITWLKSNEKHKYNQLQAELYMKALEKGEPVPAHLFTKPEEPKKGNWLSAGIICIAAGIGLSLSLWLISVFSQTIEDMSLAFRVFASLGIIPFLVGVAFLLIHFIEKKKTAGENAQ